MAVESTFSDSARAGSLRPGRAAFLVLAMCFVLALVGRGLGETFTVFLLPISETFGWPRADVVSIYSLSSLAMGLASPFVGRLFDLSGPRVVYALGLLLLGAGLSLAAFADKLWQLQVCVGFAAGLGISCLANVPSSLLLGRWFGNRLPTAMAVVYSATGAGVLTLVPLSQVLIEKFGWRGSYHFIGGGVLMLLVPLILLPWQRIVEGDIPTRMPQAESLIDEGLTLLQALRHHAFWALFSTFFFTMPDSTGIFRNRSSFFGGILWLTACWNLTHSRGTEKNTVGRARCMSVVKVSRLSAKNTCMPVVSCACSTSARSTTCDSGRYDSMRESAFCGMRSRPAATAAMKLPKVCITPLGAPVVPEVYMMVDRSSAGRTGSPARGAVLATMSSQPG